MSGEYDDDRYGMMRVHIAQRRGQEACRRYTRNALRNHAKSKGFKFGRLTKMNMAWMMAQNGLIDSDGYLRDGFPEVKVP